MMFGEDDFEEEKTCKGCIWLSEIDNDYGYCTNELFNYSSAKFKVAKDFPGCENWEKPTKDYI